MGKARMSRNFKFTDVLKGAADEAVMREEGERLAVQIENRTLSGLDEDRKSFAPYSPNYRKPTYGGRGTVDLHASGKMFEDFGVVSVKDNKVQLGFRTEESETLARWHETGAGRLPVRKFLGVPASWIAELRRRIIARIR